MKGPRLYLGVDPGVGGGIAAVDGNGRVVETLKMPETERDLFQALQRIADLTLDETGHNQIYAALEQVSGGLFAGKSGRMGVSSAFTFGKGYGALRMALTAAGIPFEDVTPQAWQKALGCRSKGDKNITKQKAQALFPSAKVTHAIADCLLLAEWCRRARLGQLAA